MNCFLVLLELNVSSLHGIKMCSPLGIECVLPSLNSEIVFSWIHPGTHIPFILESSLRFNLLEYQPDCIVNLPV